MITARRISFIAVFILILISSLSINAAESNGNIKQFDFAESLFAEGDYFRAITEYKRFNFFYPQDKSLIEKSTFRIGESYFHAGRWKQAAAEFAHFCKAYPESALYSDARYLKGLSEMKLRQIGDALTTFDDIIKDTSDIYYDDAIYQIALIRIEEREWQKARNTLSLIPKESVLFNSAGTMSVGLDQIDQIPQKSPVIAGTLAAVIPGSGHLYTERPKDAIVAFLLNGSFIWAAIELFDNDQHVAGTIVTFFELGWYSGNIYSAVSSAYKYNRGAQDKFIKTLKEKSGISFYYNPHTHRNQVMLSLRF